MRMLVGVIVAVGLTCLPQLRAEDADARAILDRAIKAHGGAEKLSKWRVSSRSGEGIGWTAGQERRFKTEVIVRLPEQIRVTIFVMNLTIRSVIDGDKGWEQGPSGAVVNMGEQRLKEMRQEAYLWWIATLAPLKKEGFALTALPEKQVEGKTLAGIKVASRGHADVTLLFDKETNLLARMSYRGTEEGVRVTKEYLFSDYKEFEGTQLPTREIVRLDGTRMTQVKYSDYKVVDRPEAGTFDKP